MDFTEQNMGRPSGRPFLLLFARFLTSNRQRDFLGFHVAQEYWLSRSEGHAG